jgi:hypothetical protein
MKNTLLGFFLAVILIIGTASTTISIMTVKPALPVSTVCFRTNYTSDMPPLILKYTSKGYIVKSLATSNYATIVVMEKY